MPENDANENPYQTLAGIKTVRLYKPITVNGTEITEIPLDFNPLTAADLDEIEADMAVSGTRYPVPAVTSVYNLRVAAKAAGINYNELKRLSAKDATTLTLLARNFLME